jgi:endonuclease/exonuclease/phosphatase (EEP) superfamily protein YafD
LIILIHAPFGVLFGVAHFSKKNYEVFGAPLDWIFARANVQNSARYWQL